MTVPGAVDALRALARTEAQVAPGLLYHRLGVALAAAGVAVVRVGYRRPNDLDRCSHDLAASVEMVVAGGAERVEGSG